MHFPKSATVQASRLALPMMLALSLAGCDHDMPPDVIHCGNFLAWHEMDWMKIVALSPVKSTDSGTFTYDLTYEEGNLGRRTAQCKVTHMPDGTPAMQSLRVSEGETPLEEDKLDRQHNPAEDGTVAGNLSWEVPHYRNPASGVQKWAGAIGANKARPKNE